MSSSFKADKEKVEWGIKQGFLLGATFHAVGFVIAPAAPALETLVERLVFTLRWQFLCSLLLLTMTSVCGHIRFNTPAIDPTKREGASYVDVHVRVIQNTLEQLVMHTFGILVFSTFASQENMRMIPVMVISFIVGRILFWIGYVRSPLRRSPGMAMTGLSNMILYACCIYSMLFYGPGYGLTDHAQ